MLHSSGPLQNKIRPARRRHDVIASKAEKHTRHSTKIGTTAAIPPATAPRTGTTRRN